MQFGLKSVYRKKSLYLDLLSNFFPKFWLLNPLYFDFIGHTSNIFLVMALIQYQYGYIEAHPAIHYPNLSC